MIIARTLAMIVTMTFRIPYGAYCAFYAFTVPRDSSQITGRTARTKIISYACGAAYGARRLICKVCKERSNGKSSGVLLHIAGTAQIEGARKLNKRMAPQVGLESTIKRSFNTMQVSGWHLRPRNHEKQ
jgi:hypothetical protein